MQPSTLQMTAMSALDPSLDQYANIPVPLVDYVVGGPPLPQPLATSAPPPPRVPTTGVSTFVGTPNGRKRKVRGEFPVDERVKVRKVRQKGACLRCRMLKKSCDENDPCGECSKLDNARLWKAACTRIRMTELFTASQSNYFRITAYQAEQRVRALGQSQAKTGRLEVTLFPTTGVFLALPWTMALGNNAFLSNNASNVSDKLKGYVFTVLANMKEKTAFSVSQFVKHTLDWAIGSCNGSEVCYMPAVLGHP